MPIQVYCRDIGKMCLRGLSPRCNFCDIGYLTIPVYCLGIRIQEGMNYFYRLSPLCNWTHIYRFAIQYYLGIRIRRNYYGLSPFYNWSYIHYLPMPVYCLGIRSFQRCYRLFHQCTLPDIGCLHGLSPFYNWSYIHYLPMPVYCLGIRIRHNYYGLSPRCNLAGIYRIQNQVY